MSIETNNTKFAPLTDLQRAEESQWETLSSRFPDTFPGLNDSLRNRTFLLGTNSPSKSDIDIFTKIFPFIKESTTSDSEFLVKFRHIIRWFDLIQHTTSQKEIIKFNYDLEIPREIKPKVEKKPTSTENVNEQKKEKPKKEKKQKSDKAAHAKPQAPAAETPEHAEGAHVSEEEAKKLRQEKKEKKAKAKAKKQPAKVELIPSPALVDFRVGFIQKAIAHPNADSLYVSTIDMGDPEGPRTVCSGLVKYIPLEEMQQRYVIVIANLKPVNMRGVKSCAMVLCASDEDHGKVEFVNPPSNSKAGDKIFFETFDGTPEPILPPKKKIFETVQPNFTTTEDLDVIYKEDGKPDKKLINKNGELCKASTLINATVR